MLKMKLILLLFITTMLSGIIAEKKVICYVESWAIYRSGNGAFQFEDIDPNLCTHVNYAFVGINDDGSIRIDDGTDGFSRLNSLKNQGTGLKTMVSIGGWSEGSAGFSKVANDDSRRGSFVNNAISFLQQYNFDGLDIDWEYPGQREGSQSSDKQAFITLLRDLRSAFDQHGYILSVAVGAGSWLGDSSYDIPAISQYVDFINLMTYDFHSSDDGVTGENAPLYADPGDGDQTNNVAGSIQYWLQKGAAPEKLIMGMGLYGHTYLLANADDRWIGSKSVGPGGAGPYTGGDGMLGYNEICEYQMNSNTWHIEWDDDAKVPYASDGLLWVGYDSPDSLWIKAQYVVDNGLGGAMVWSIDTDDVNGICGQKYHLMNNINKVLRP